MSNFGIGVSEDSGPTNRGFTPRVRDFSQCLHSALVALENSGMPQLESVNEVRLRKPTVIPFVAKEHVASMKLHDIQLHYDDAQVSHTLICSQLES